MLKIINNPLKRFNLYLHSGEFETFRTYIEEKPHPMKRSLGVRLLIKWFIGLPKADKNRIKKAMILGE